MARPRVLIGGLSHETHTFVPQRTALPDFDTLPGNEMWRAIGDSSTIAGMMEVAKACDWDAIPTIDMVGGAGGLVLDEVVEAFWAAFEAAARDALALPGGVDGVCLNMHGAMVSESFDDVEGELLRRMRTLPGLERSPICGVLDLHGNITQAMATHSNGLVAYRENPHTDGKQAAMDGARLLDRLMRGDEQAVTIWERPPLMLPPISTGTADEPMRALEAMARDIERSHPEMLVVNVFAGFSFSDMADAGVSFTAVTVGDPDAARRELRRLSDAAMAMKQHALPTGITLDEAMERLKSHAEGPIVLVEPADNIGGGTYGDLTIVLRALLDHDVANAGAVICDPEAVQLVSQLQPGQRVRTPIGGKSGSIGAQPLDLEVELISTSDGHFRCEDPHSHMAVNGLDVAMGPSAVVRCQGVTILLTSIPTAPMDLAQWRSQGIAPESFFAVNVKAAVAHRQAYNPIARASYVLNTPGPCTPDLRTLPIKKVKRPLYPLDEI
jgi:microcystin degradation protein MlrC